MQVKDILKGLVGDNLIETDKIGSTNFYWSLPTRVYQAKTNLNQKLEEQKQALGNETLQIEEKIKNALVERQDTEERKANSDKLTELIQQQVEFQKVIKNFEKKDPERYENIVKETKILNELYGHWVDNIYTIVQWLREKHPGVTITEMFPDLNDFHLFDEE